MVKKNKPEEGKKRAKSIIVVKDPSASKTEVESSPFVDVEAPIKNDNVELHEQASELDFGKWNTPCSRFFQQKGAINFQDYLRLKQEEKEASLQFKSARKIQAAWRGFITRYKMHVLTLAAIKIQAFLRGIRDRRKVAKLKEDIKSRRRSTLEHEAAIKIQKAWRGYISRKNKFNFKEYKEIQKKNAALSKSIEKINQLEDALGTGKASSLTDLENMSQSRIEELYSYATSALSAEKKKKCPSKGKFRIDSVSDLFPEFPDKEGVIRPRADKVEALKEAIRLLQRQMQSNQAKGLMKAHYLLRTSTQPGIYSDIYCNELTEFEKELKSIKYWTAPPDPRKKQTPESKTEQRKSSAEISSTGEEEEEEDTENMETSTFPSDEEMYSYETDEMLPE